MARSVLALQFFFFAAAAPAAQDSDLYASLADQARETAAMARRTAAGERENAERARENAQTWRELADEARALGQEENARSAEARAERAETDADEADAAANRAMRRAQIAEREAVGFDEKAGRAGAQEARDSHVAVLTDSDTVFHRLYILGDPDNDDEGDAWAAEQTELQQTLERDGNQAASSTTSTLVTPKRDDLAKKLEELQKIAVPGNEFTLYFSGHGGGGPFWGGKDLEDEDDEEFEEHIGLNESQTLSDDELAQMLSGFAPGVSITLLMDSCFGGGFTGGSTDVQESASVDVIGVGNTCPSTGDTLTTGSINGLRGAADYNGDGTITAVELENYLRADGWDVRTPHDNSDDLSFREQLETWGTDLQNWYNGAKVRKPTTGSDTGTDSGTEGDSETSTDLVDPTFDILSNPEIFNPVSGSREMSVQLMIIDSVVDELGEIVVLADAHREPSEPLLFLEELRRAFGGLSFSARPANAGAALPFASLLESRRARGSLRVSTSMSSAQAPEVSVSAFITSLGTSYGESMQLQLFNTGDAPARLSGKGIVVEPLKKKAKEEMQKQLSKLAGRNPVTAKVNAYCLEFLREPPSLGTVFKIADQQLQEQFAPMRHVLDASQKLRDLGSLTPDTEATEYFNSIRQWSIWSKERGFDDEKSFENAFIERTKDNFEASGQPFTKEIETAVRRLVPNRWKDVTSVLAEADAMAQP